MPRTTFITSSTPFSIKPFKTHTDQSRTLKCQQQQQPSTSTANNILPLEIKQPDLTSINYGRIQHAGVLVTDTEKSKEFYMKVYGMQDDDHLRNPKLPFKGSFMRAGSSQIHLMELPSPDPIMGRPIHGGRDKHVAVTIKDLNPLIDSLEYHGRYYTFSKSGRRALFTRDIDMNALEFIEDPDI